VDNLILHTVACIGLTFILKYGTILSSIRRKLSNYSSSFRELFKCSLCLGFWSGLTIGLIGPYNPIIFCVYGAAVCWIADLTLDKIFPEGN